MNNKNKIIIWIPIIIAVSVVSGILIGNSFSNQKFISENDRKLNTILNLIGEEYVDTVNINDLIENSIPKILANLDPHSVYIPAKDFDEVNGELEGSFSGIGIAFTIMNDTVTINEVISGGPSEKVGILAGDRIVSANDTTLIGLSQEGARKHLLGDKGTVVKLGIKRPNSKKIYTYKVTRGDIPINTIDASYLIEKKTGYIKVNKFGKNTYNEFLSHLMELKKQGADRYIIDLRGNGGGLMEPAILMANEFLPESNLIVYTKGREKKNDQEFWSDGNGSFKDSQLIVLIDEYSASASEIFTGAIQDNDRGLIIGRRSFGKGLIQQQFSLSDNSAIRLTIGRYYTPSGRCIQKDFKHGDDNTYSLEVFDRYNHGEIYNQDSIKFDKSKIFETVNGRKVYGGGGIIPDIFVPNDTAGISSYYISVANAGLLQKFAFSYADINREALKKMNDYTIFLSQLPSNDAFLNDFVSYATENGIPARWYYINLSRNLLLTQLKALISKDAFGMQSYFQIMNSRDSNIKAAMNAFRKNKAEYPIKEQMKWHGK